MRKLLHIILLLAATLSLVTACKPQFPNIGHPQAGSPPFYERGWNEGCETGLAAYGTSFYKSFYHFKQSPELTANTVYYQAWNDAFAYCRHFALRWSNQGSLDEVDNIFKDQPFPDDPSNFYKW
ncbi:MAG: hypothetical protein IPP74_09435 [Alphaproteobacteria bacterium]|nr:hypothetical protein [Alphaproteobacteria bacterium]